MPEARIRELSPYRVLRRGEMGEPESLYERQSGHREVHLRDYWRIVMKYRRVVLGVLAIVVASTGLIVFTMDPLYKATATIQIDRQAPNVAPVQQVQQVDAQLAYDKYDYYQTQYEVLESRTVAARVIRSLALDQDTRFVGVQSSGLIAMLTGWLRALLPVNPADGQNAEELGVDPHLIEEYLNMLSIEPVRNSRLVRVGFLSKYADLSSGVANKHVEEYTNASMEQRLDMTLKAKEFLEKELAKAKERVDGAEVALNKFRKDKRIVSLDGGKTDIVSERLGDLNARHTDAQAERIRLQGQYDLIKRRDFESLPDVVTSPLIAQLKQEAARIEAERAELARKFKPGYPKMKELMAREEQARARIDAEVRKIVGGIESSYLAAKSREEELARQLENQRVAALDQKDVGADYDTLKRDVDTARALYANLLQRLKDIDVAEEIKVSNVSVVDRAAVPRETARPRKLLDLTLAAMFGTILGISLAFFLDYLDDTVKTPDDVERRLGLPTLGVVPAFDTPASTYGSYTYGHGARRRSVQNATSRDNGSVAMVARSDHGSLTTELMVSQYPRSIIAEAYRTIRTGILLSSAGDPPQVVLFTSGSAGEGKTVTAVNEALTLVQAGSRVLLIDADIRKPRVHRIFQVPNGHGLSTYLTSQSTLDQVIHEVHLNGHTPSAVGGENGLVTGKLHVLPSGPMPPNPAELVGSRRMRETIDELRAKYDHIVIDTPPVLPVTDAVLMATMSDGVVLVVRGQETPAEVAAKSRDRLDYARAKILGVVLNDVDVESGDYSQYYRYYAYYSSHIHGDRDAVV